VSNRPSIRPVEQCKRLTIVHEILRAPYAMTTHTVRPYFIIPLHLSVTTAHEIVG
jgi:hypothetical protein